MKSCQIAAGIVPPYTEGTPMTFCNGISAFGQPIHTHVVSCGVYPQNQASTLSFAVPVFPAAGRPIEAAYPVPDVITPCSAFVTSSASFASNACTPGERTSPIDAPPSVIFTNGVAQ